MASQKVSLPIQEYDLIGKTFFPDVYVNPKKEKTVYPKYGSKQGDSPSFIIGPIRLTTYDAGIPSPGKYKESIDKCNEISIPLKPEESEAAAVVLEKLNGLDKYMHMKLNVEGNETSKLIKWKPDPKKNITAIPLEDEIKYKRLVKTYTPAEIKEQLAKEIREKQKKSKNNKTEDKEKEIDPSDRPLQEGEYRFIRARFEMQYPEKPKQGQKKNRVDSDDEDDKPKEKPKIKMTVRTSENGYQKEEPEVINSLDDVKKYVMRGCSAYFVIEISKLYLLPKQKDDGITTFYESGFMLTCTDIWVDESAPVRHSSSSLLKTNAFAALKPAIKPSEEKPKNDGGAGAAAGGSKPDAKQGAKSNKSSDEDDEGDDEGEDEGDDQPTIVKQPVVVTPPKAAGKLAFATLKKKFT
jgi:hypothetical protein